MYLDLSSHKFTCFEPGLFSGLSNLKNLSFKFNGLTTLDDNVFKDLHKLEKLTLNGNKFASIQSQVFKPLVNLKELFIDYHLFVDSEDLRNCVVNYRYNWWRIDYSESASTSNKKALFTLTLLKSLIIRHAENSLYLKNKI